MASRTSARLCCRFRQSSTSFSRLEPLQQGLGDLLDRRPFLLRELDFRLGQDVEQGQLFFGQPFPDAALSSSSSSLTNGQFLEELLDVPAAGVVFVNHAAWNFTR